VNAMSYHGRKHVQANSNNLMTLPAGGFWVCEIPGRVGLLWIPVLAHKGVGVFLLIEITECVVDFAMLALICTNYNMSVGNIENLLCRCLL
jgi:hypothetical protein